MATYTCPQCEMSVNIHCATCDDELVHDSIVTDTGVEVAVARCPQGHGMIKSPQCCGQDMSCAL